MAKVQSKLGSRAYLFHTAPNVYAQAVVISAHGYYLPTTGDLSPGFPTLRFYCADKGTVDDIPQSTRIRNTPPIETVPNATTAVTRNYLLYKFGEHKSTIKAMRDDHNRRSDRQHRMTFADAEHSLGTISETYATFRNVTDLNNDYVTIRNVHSLFGGPVISLQELIRLIQEKHNYAEIKCCFCREAKPAGYSPDLNADR